MHNLIGTTSIIPFFHPNKNVFWYLFEDSNKKSHYYSYDRKRGKQELYNVQVIDSILKINEEANRYISFSPEFLTDRINADFSYNGNVYKYDSKYRSVSKTSLKVYPILEWGMSPKKNYQVKVDNYNLFIRKTNSDIYHQLSFDGEKNNSFDITDLSWLNDSIFYIVRNNSSNVRNFAILRYLNTPPESVNYQYEIPGDTAVAHQSLYCYNVNEDKYKEVNVDKWKDQQLEIVPVKDVIDKIFFIRRKRTRDQLDICYYDTKNENIVTVVHYESKPYINEDMFQCKIVNSGKDIFVWSNKTDWGHYYHYSISGKLLNAVTHGNWTAGKICSVDIKNKFLYLYGYGRERGINPNYSLLYKVSFDGRKIKLLTPENANHSVFISPNEDIIVDNCSRIDTVPLCKVRDNDGRLLTIVEKPDISKLINYGWKMPEQFVVKAADGKTNLYGIMWKPFDFDPHKKYPIISQVYPGPQIETVWPDFTVFDRYNNTDLAQKGFIVVCMGHRGGSPYRDKAYAQYCYGNLRDYPLADDRIGIEELAEKYQFIDINRVGIYGHSGGAMMAVTAICTYPDFYKVAVASSGNYDNYIYNRTWGETYQGISDDDKFTVKTDEQLVSGLRGHLLLVTGDADENVNPANTFRLVNALILADKKFQLIVLPGQTHHYEEPYEKYFEKLKRDFFAKYL